MGKENWIERFKRRRQEKKIAKLRIQFGFILEEYHKSIKEIENRLEMSFIALEGNLKENKSSIEELLIEILKKMDEITVENTKSYENVKETFSEMISLNNEKISQSTEYIGNVVDKKYLLIQEVISQIKDKTENEYQDIIRVLQNIGDQLEMIQRKINGLPDTTGAIIDEKATTISLSIDEIKTLMKVVAVNNLLEEIGESRSKNEERSHNH